MLRLWVHTTPATSMGAFNATSMGTYYATSMGTYYATSMGTYYLCYINEKVHVHTHTTKPFRHSEISIFVSGIGTRASECVRTFAGKN